MPGRRALRSHGDALLWVFSYESPYSWALPDQPQDYPGLLDGVPEHLVEHLPDDHPRSVSGCWWYTAGAWRMGNPAPSPDDLENQGEHLFETMLVSHPSEAAFWLYEKPEQRIAADEIVALVDCGLTVTREAIVALTPIHDADAMLARARELGI